MLKFRGFRASLHFGGKKQADAFQYYTTDTLSMSGAYRANREEIGNGNYNDTRTRITPEMVKLPPPTKPDPSLRPAKSTNDLLYDYPNAKLHEDLQSSASDISMNPRGALEPIRDKKGKKQEKDIKKIEKRAIEKTKKETTQEKANQERKEKKSKAPKEPPTAAKRSNPMALLMDYDSSARSVSRTSGPPPYEDVPDKLEVIPIPNQDDEKPTGNIKFSKPIEEASSWDLVSQHREQMNRPVPPERKTKKTVMDLNFKIDLDPEGTGEKINSEA